MWGMEVSAINASLGVGRLRVHTEDPNPSMGGLPSGVASSVEISMLGVDILRTVLLSGISEDSGEAILCVSGRVASDSTLEIFDST